MKSTLTQQFVQLVRDLEPYGLIRGPLHLHGLLTGYTIADADPELLLDQLCRESAEVPTEEQASVFQFTEGVLAELELERFEPLLEWDGARDPAQWAAGLKEGIGLASVEWRDRCAAALAEMNGSAEAAEPQAAEPSPMGKCVVQLYQTTREEYLAQQMAEFNFEVPEFTAHDLDRMDPEDLMELFRVLGARMPGSVVEALARRGDSILKALGQVFERSQEEGLLDRAEPGYWNPIHALFVLGLMEGNAAADRLLEQLAGAVSYNREEMVDFWAALFSNKGAYGRELLRRHAEDPHAELQGRSGAVGALLFLSREEGPEALEPCIDWVARLGQEALPPEFRPNLLSRLLDYPRERCRGMLYGLVDHSANAEAPNIMEDEDRPLTREDVDEFFQQGDAEELEEIPLDPLDFYQMRQIWERISATGEPLEGEEEYDEEFVPPVTYRREAPKVGRNDPCPCGSGKKYKKCCMER